jgi:hypothetical protein
VTRKTLAERSTKICDKENTGRKKYVTGREVPRFVTRKTLAERSTKICDKENTGREKYQDL